MEEKLRSNLLNIHQRIERACNRAHRDINEVRLLLATKTVNVESIRNALELGETLIGENKVQELKQKADAISSLKPEIHFIGHLQTNKIKEVIKYASCIQSIDRLGVAEKLHKRLVREGKTIEVMVQVNSSNEKSKFGIDPAQAVEFVQKIATFDTLKIKGLMTIGLLSSNTEHVRTCFRLLRKVQEEINQLRIPNVQMYELSMGMSKDLEIAIEEGSTMIRIGTAIFGERIQPDSYYWNENI